jgi:hypothetical protein
MKRSCLWLCTLTAATAAAVSDARAFSPHGPSVHGFARLIAGPEWRGPGGGAPPVGAIKPPAPPAPTGHYNFSGNSFNLSVTRNGRPMPPPPPVAPPPPGAAERPGFFQRLFDWW